MPKPIRIQQRGHTTFHSILVVYQIVEEAFRFMFFHIEDLLKSVNIACLIWYWIVKIILLFTYQFTKPISLYSCIREIFHNSTGFSNFKIERSVGRGNFLFKKSFLHQHLCEQLERAMWKILERTLPTEVGGLAKNWGWNRRWCLVFDQHLPKRIFSSA